ncbi:hypothetical protein SAMN05444274_10370 [Mariniphaga anaerophila]|uniref:Extracellular endo-alpha-(1->5)-L-arabinanase C-terminal domain-containing protein n=1 Tax=Mariniphaga anaerophila TaxID=1484053 RepID=A0A1M4XP51_9BACT|nr:hypothetical protein [Mariniphaga anaerophila]SHE95210.1 hypothetical protein SAMN05444274_10370 [Mariniphaga anaerophila]
MKKLLLFMMLAFMATTISYANNASSHDDVLGEWKFESPNAPYGYNSGAIIIKEKDGALAGEIKFSDGTKVELKDILLEEGVLKFGINVEYNYVLVKATIEGNMMKGTANSPDGKLPFEAKKVEKQ